METLNLIQRGKFYGVLCTFRTMPKSAKLYGYDYINNNGNIGNSVAIYYTATKRGIKYFLSVCKN